MSEQDNPILTCTGSTISIASREPELYVHVDGKDYEIPKEMWKAFNKVQEIEAENKALKDTIETIREWVDFWVIDIRESLGVNAYNTICKILNGVDE
jgi:hypothetical protein